MKSQTFQLHQQQKQNILEQSNVNQSPVSLYQKSSFLKAQKHKPRISNIGGAQQLVQAGSSKVDFGDLSHVMSAEFGSSSPNHFNRRNIPKVFSKHRDVFMSTSRVPQMHKKTNQINYSVDYRPSSPDHGFASKADIPLPQSPIVQKKELNLVPKTFILKTEKLKPHQNPIQNSHSVNPQHHYDTIKKYPNYEENTLQKIDRTKNTPKRYPQLPQKSLFMNSYLIKGGVLLAKNDDASLINEVDSFISMYQYESSQNLSNIMLSNASLQEAFGIQRVKPHAKTGRRLLQSRFDNMSVGKASSTSSMAAHEYEKKEQFIDTNKGVLMLLRDTPID